MAVFRCLACQKVADVPSRPGEHQCVYCTAPFRVVEVTIGFTTRLRTLNFVQQDHPLKLLAGALSNT
jgi:hypothetical protein